MNMRSEYDVHGLSDEDLCKYIGSLKNYGPRIYAEGELRRRLDLPAAQRAWIVVGISVASLVLSLAAFLSKVDLCR